MNEPLGVWVGSTPRCDIVVSHPLDGVMYDARTIYGSWACLCGHCYEVIGLGRLGTGYGQKYRQQDDGSWLKVEG